MAFLWKVVSTDFVPRLAHRLDNKEEDRLILFPTLMSAVEAEAYSARRMLSNTPTSWIPTSDSQRHNLTIPTDSWNAIRKKGDTDKTDHENLAAVKIFVHDVHDHSKCQALPQGGAAYIFTSKIRASRKEVLFYKVHLTGSLVWQLQDCDSHGPCAAQAAKLYTLTLIPEL